MIPLNTWVCSWGMGCLWKSILLQGRIVSDGLVRCQSGQPQVCTYISQMFLTCHGQQYMVLQPCQYKASAKPGLYCWICDMTDPERNDGSVLSNVKTTGDMPIGHGCTHAPYVNLWCAPTTHRISLEQNRQLCVPHTWVKNRSVHCGESLLVQGGMRTVRRANRNHTG